MEMEMEMMAGVDIEIGQDISPPLTPLCVSLHDSFLHSHCSSCFSPLPNPPFPPTTSDLRHHQPTVLYCCPLCSASDSPLHFSSAEFHVLQSLHFPNSPSSDLRAALRLLHSLPHCRQYDRIFGLLTNRNKLITDYEIFTEVREGARAMAAARRLRDGDTVNDDTVLEEEVAALCLVLTNAVEVQDDKGRCLGIAVYDPSFSWINHSCSPNASYRFVVSPPDAPPLKGESSLRIVPAGCKGESGVCSSVESKKGCSEYGPRIIVRSIKRIKKGEEVTVAYTDLLRPKAVRQLELWSRYRFICHCIRCDASPPSFVDHSLQEISASSLPSSSIVSDHSFYSDDATRKLTDYVDEVITEYLSTGDPYLCCEKLESMLSHGLFGEQLETKEGKSQLNFRLHPVHHLALNAYITLASAYKIRACDLLLAHYSEVDRCLGAFNMSRISAAYSFFLASATYYLFSFESSLIASVANFWTNAGESLLTLARSSAWNLFKKCELPVSNLSSQCKCPQCSLLDRFETNLFLNQYQSADFENISSEFVNCITNLSQKVWDFLVQDCHYLKIFKDPLDFSCLRKSSSTENFGASNHMNANCQTTGSLYKFEAEENSDQGRVDIFQLGVHCLLYGGFLASICYGQHSNFTSHIQGVLYYEGK